MVGRRVTCLQLLTHAVHAAIATQPLQPAAQLQAALDKDLTLHFLYNPSHR